MVILKVWSEQGSRVFFFIISKLEAFPIYDIMMESLLLHSPIADVKFLFKRCFKLPLPV